MEVSSQDERGPLWAISSYYNPHGYVRRLENYRLFRRHLGLPLLSVELTFDGRYELDASDAQIMVRLAGGAVLWQKERLLNIALARLPLSCESVVWMDCDVIFPRNDWAPRLEEQLANYPLVQPFAQIVHLPADFAVGHAPDPALVRSAPSAASLIANGASAADCLGKAGEFQHRKRVPGFVWAARRELLAEHGFYDACITGGGDVAMAAAAYRVPDAAASWQAMNRHQSAHYLAWAKRFARDVKGQIGLVETDLWHLWHGQRKDRRFYQRYLELRPFDFDPARDVIHAPGGPWRWNSHKSALHEHLRDYFAARQEDLAIPDHKAA